MQRYVLDTNVLIASISDRSPHHWIWLSLTQDKEFILCVTTDILEEYEEVLQRFYGAEAATIVMEAFDNLSNIEYITRYYCWNLIVDDPDDNKFVDCAVAAQAKFIVSEDKHFNVLKNDPNPFITAIKIAEFKTIMGK
jgi:putative PIN family toxin of toxin-antitoxin system